MAKVIWNRQAENEWRHYLVYGLSEFGQMTALRFVRRTNYVVDIITKYPKSGLREPLLHSKRKIYRYYHIVGSLKLLYYYIESSDTIRIVDIWDSRKEPKKLFKRIR